MSHTRKKRLSGRFNRITVALTSLSKNPDFVCAVIMVLLLVTVLLAEVSK